MTNRHSQPLTTAMLAERLGISRATVSYVLNGQARQRKISDETADRVRREADRLNFVPNELARGLRRNRSGLIGFLAGSFTFNWAERILTAMLEVLETRGCLPFTMIHRWSPDLEERAIQSMLNRRVDGVICVPVPGREAAYRRLIDRGIPLLFLGDRLKEMDDVSFVAWNVRGPAEQAVSHLIETGRRRIAFMAADHQTVMTRARYEGYKRALRRADIKVNRKWVAWEPVKPFPSPPEMVERMLDRILRSGEPKPDGLFVGHDALAVRALDQLKSRRVRIPQDIAVASLCDLFMSDHSGISLTTVAEPSKQIGKRAAEIMMTMIEQPGSSPIQELIESVDLRVRRSSQSPRRNTGCQRNSVSRLQTRW